MTPADQRKAKALLTKALFTRDSLDEGEAVDVDTDDKLTRDIRVFLISVGAIPDRRKKGKPK